MSMRNICVSVSFGLMLLTNPSAWGQSDELPEPLDPGMPPIYQAPGYYGMAYGTASFNVPRTYSNFPSPFRGGGYGYGYDPYTLAPNRFGRGLWRPGADPNLSPAEQNRYWTFPLSRETAERWPQPVPVGYYAPALGPPIWHRPSVRIQP